MKTIMFIMLFLLKFFSEAEISVEQEGRLACCNRIVFQQFKDTKSSLFFKDSIYSQNLKENRSIQIYLPPCFDETITYPVIIACDGQIIEDGYDILIDSLICANLIEPIVLIAPHSNEKSTPNGLQLRNVEYLSQSTDKKRYLSHYRFFTSEVMNFVSNKYGVNYSGVKIFYGTSNGAAFGFDLLSKDEMNISYYIALSPLGSNLRKIKKNKKNPTIFIAYGDKEIDFYKNIGIQVFDDLIKDLQSKQYTLEVDVYQGGHERQLWKKSFSKFLIDIFEIIAVAEKTKAISIKETV